jgi:hypothetical protein
MSQKELVVDKLQLKKMVAAVLEPRVDQSQLFNVETEPPERKFVTLLKEKGLELEQDEFVYNALFMTTTLVLGENTTYFFKRISNRERLEKYAWIFQPEKVVEKADLGDKGEIEEAVLQFFRPAGYNRKSVEEWVHNCRVLHDNYGGDIRNLFKSCDDEAEGVVKKIMVRPRAKTSEKKGLRRAGIKIATLYVQWLGFHGLYRFKNIGKNGTPMDFQAIRVPVQCNVIEMDGPENADKVGRRTLLPAMVELCAEEGYDTARVSEAIWQVGKRCNREMHQGCPLDDKELCTKLISRRPYDKGGMIDPTDVGRYGKRS